MRRIITTVIALCAIALAASPAAAQKKAKPAAECEPCICPETPPSAPVREGGLAECTDGIDNDRDGHLDCLDQDCEIYAVCAAPQPAAYAVPAPPPAPTRTYTTMRELKRDLRAGLISGRDFVRWQSTIRAWRAAEIETVKAEYRSGQISHDEYERRVEFIRRKYEG